MNNYLDELIQSAHPLHDKQGIGPLVRSLKDKKSCDARRGESRNERVL